MDPEPEDVQDPVCGERFPASVSTFQATHRERTYHFCCAHCQASFAEEPERYAEGP